MSSLPVERKSLDEWIANIENDKTKHYIEDRVVNQMNYYRNKSKEYKKKYHELMTVSIIIGFLIPVTSILADGSIFMKLVIATLGSATTAISAYLRMQNYYELWSNYRYNREFLLSTLYAYFTNTGIFRQLSTQQECDTLLIDTCEACFSTENKGWLDLLREDEQKK